jgi:hypothetical protein
MKLANGSPSLESVGWIPGDCRAHRWGFRTAWTGRHLRLCRDQYCKAVDDPPSPITTNGGRWSPSDRSAVSTWVHGDANPDRTCAACLLDGAGWAPYGSDHNQFTDRTRFGNLPPFPGHCRSRHPYVASAHRFPAMKQRRARPLAGHGSSIRDAPERGFHA